MTLSEGEGKEFGSRSEAWDPSSKKWTVRYSIVDVGAVPSIASVGSVEFEGKEVWENGETVVVQGERVYRSCSHIKCKLRWQSGTLVEVLLRLTSPKLLLVSHTIN